MPVDHKGLLYDAEQEEQNAERLLTAVDLATRWAVHVETVRKWAREGLLPHTHLQIGEGTKRTPIRFRLSAVVRFEVQNRLERSS